MIRFPAILCLLLPLFGSCAASLPQVDTPAAEVHALSGNSPPMPRLVAHDEITRKTDRQLAAVGANNLDALKPDSHGAMERKDGMAHGAGTHGPGGQNARTSKPAMDHGQHSPTPAVQGEPSSHQHH